MSTADDDRWDSLEGVEEYHQPFPKLDAETRQRAIDAVNEALVNYKPPSLASRVWSVLWLWQYMLKLRFAVRLTAFLCRDGRRDPRLVSQKLWRKLNI